MAKTSALRPAYSERPPETEHISWVHTPVKARGKKRSKVFFFPKLSLNLTSFKPSLVEVFRVKSGALVPMASGIVEYGSATDEVRLAPTGGSDLVEAEACSSASSFANRFLRRPG